MDSHKDMNVNKFRIPTTKHFFEGGFIGGVCREMGCENKEVETMTTCYCL